MKKAKPFLKYLLMLIPLLPGIPLLTLRGYRFSGICCVLLSLLIGLFCTLSLFRGPVSKVLRRVLIGILCIAGISGGITEIYILQNSRSTQEPCSYVVLLGAGLHGTKPSLILQNRLDAAAAYLRAHPQTVCVLSGGQGRDEIISEAGCMYQELTAMGISPHRLLCEEKSRSTAENLAYSLELIQAHHGRKPEKIGIISNEFHLARAKIMARDLGVEPVGIPASTSLPFLKVNYFVREIPALWKYLILGGT